MGPRFVQECVVALGAEGGALYHTVNTQPSLIFKSTGWVGLSVLDILMSDDLGNLGMISFGRKKSGAPYSDGDRKAVEALANVVAPALGWECQIE